MIEYAAMLPLMIVITGLVFSAAIYAVTQYALGQDVAQAAGRAVQVAVRTPGSRYCQAVEAFVRDALDAQAPFYAYYVRDLRTTQVSIGLTDTTPGQRVLSVRREGDFDLLNSRDRGLALTVAGQASVVLPGPAADSACGDTP
ncbi:hypothetical protein T5B8_15055 [Salinisphaera sp. T5B8]|uniref:hypothetical protein n=1 Tax=Salinisphaera sp. T5B8 TaxID=1304154 RepID=UPI00333EABE7